MRRVTSAMLYVAISTSGIAAQTGPGMTDADPATPGFQAMAKSKYFTTAPGTTAQPTLADIRPAIFQGPPTSILQCSFGKTGMPGLAAGEYHMCMTIGGGGLSTAYGGSGKRDVILGKVTWNSGQPVFTPSTMAAAMNTTGDELGLIIDGKDGTRAALSKSRWSARLTNALPFPAPVSLQGTPAGPLDLSPGHLDGVLGCFYANAGKLTICWAPVQETFDSSGRLTAAVLQTSNAIVVVKAATQPHSPTPLFCQNGDAQGLWFSRTNSPSNGDQYYSGQLPDLTGGLLVSAVGNAQKGGVVGSRFFYADFPSIALLEGRGSHMTASSDIAVGAGATLDLCIYSPVGTTSVFATTLGLSLGGTAPIPLPGLLGAFALDTSKGFTIFSGPVGVTTDERAYISLPATHLGLKGLTLHFQAVTNPLAGASAAFTNTVAVRFK